MSVDRLQFFQTSAPACAPTNCVKFLKTPFHTDRSRIASYISPMSEGTRVNSDILVRSRERGTAGRNVWQTRKGMLAARRLGGTRPLPTQALRRPWWCRWQPPPGPLRRLDPRDMAPLLDDSALPRTAPLSGGLT